MARLNWCLAAVISWGKFLFACFFPLRGAKRDTVSPGNGVGGGDGGSPDLGVGLVLGLSTNRAPMLADAAGTGKMM